MLGGEVEEAAAASVRFAVFSAPGAGAAAAADASTAPRRFMEAQP